MKKKKIYSIYLVDSETESLQWFTDFWQKWPHIVFPFLSTQEARRVMAGVSPDIIFCRFDSPESTDSREDFLLWAQRKFPSAIRIIFSRKDKIDYLRRLVAGGIAHRYFALPIASADFAEFFINDLATRARLKIRRCWAFIESDIGLPSLPAVVQEIDELVRDPEFSIDQLAAVVERDVAISLRLLKVVNSAVFSRTNKISNVHHAVSFLGAGQVKEIVLFFCSMLVFPPTTGCRQETKNIASHSLQVSQLTAIIAPTVSPGREKEAATAALLHDIGKLVFLSSHCSSYMRYLKNKKMYSYSAEIFEKEIFGITHTQLGSSLLLWWNMPMTLVEVAANHNQPLAELTGICKAVAIADRCLREAQTKGEAITDLNTISADLPLDSWRNIAVQLVS